MNVELEKDFEYQQQRLEVLRSQSSNFESGSDAELESDRAIAETENLIRSYEILKYYECRPSWSGLPDPRLIRFRATR